MKYGGSSLSRRGYYPNGNMADAHGEIGAMQQLVDAGMAKGANINLKVTGKDVCGYCSGDIAAMAKKAEMSSVTIHGYEGVGKKSKPVTYYWEPGMRSIKKVKQ